MSLEQICLAVGGWLAASLGWFKWWYEVREKNKERAEKEKEKAAKEKAEAELKNIKRRGDAPLLVPSSSRFNMTGRDAGNGQLYRVSPFDTSVLCEFTNEVKIPDTETAPEVVFVIENIGQSARVAKVKLDNLHKYNLGYRIGDYTSFPVGFERAKTNSQAHFRDGHIR